MKPFDTDKMPWLFTPHGDGELNEYFSTDHSKIIAETSKEVLASLCAVLFVIWGTLTPVGSKLDILSKIIKSIIAALYFAF